MALIANHHTAPMAFPRKTTAGIVLQPTTINPGCVAEIPNDEWAEFKKTKVIQYYLDKGILSVVKNASANVVVGADRTSDPEIPEHLGGDEKEEVAPQTGVRARVKRAKPGSVDLTPPAE